LVQTGLEILKEYFELIKENILKPKKQQNDQASYTQKLKKEDTEFHWTDSISLIERKVRAFSPKPKAFFVFRKNKVFLEGGELVQQNNQETEEPVLNRLDKSERTIELKLPGGIYKIKKVLPEGRKLIPAYDFVQGLRLKIGDVFK